MKYLLILILFASGCTTYSGKAAKIWIEHELGQLKDVVTEKEEPTEGEFTEVTEETIDNDYEKFEKFHFPSNFNLTMKVMTPPIDQILKAPKLLEIVPKWSGMNISIMDGIPTPPNPNVGYSHRMFNLTWRKDTGALHVWKDWGCNSTFVDSRWHTCHDGWHETHSIKDFDCWSVVVRMIHGRAVSRSRVFDKGDVQ